MYVVHPSLGRGPDVLIAKALKACFFEAILNSDKRRSAGRTMPLAAYIADESRLRHQRLHAWRAVFPGHLPLVRSVLRARLPDDLEPAACAGRGRWLLGIQRPRLVDAGDQHRQQAVEDEKTVVRRVDRAKAEQRSRPTYKPRPDHPWRRPFKAGGGGNGGSSLHHALAEDGGPSASTGPAVSMVVTNTGTKLIFRSTDPEAYVGELCPANPRGRKVTEVRPPSTLAPGECYAVTGRRTLRATPDRSPPGRRRARYRSAGADAGTDTYRRGRGGARPFLRWRSRSHRNWRLRHFVGRAPHRLRGWATRAPGDRVVRRGAGRRRVGGAVGGAECVVAGTGSGAAARRGLVRLRLELLRLPAELPEPVRAPVPESPARGADVRSVREGLRSGAAGAPYWWEPCGGLGSKRSSPSRCGSDGSSERREGRGVVSPSSFQDEAMWTAFA